MGKQKKLIIEFTRIHLVFDLTCTAHDDFDESCSFLPIKKALKRMLDKIMHQASKCMLEP